MGIDKVCYNKIKKVFKTKSLPEKDDHVTFFIISQLMG